MEEENYKAYLLVVDKMLKLKKKIDLFEDPKLFIVYLDRPRLVTYAEFLNKNDVIVRYVIKIKKNKAVIYLNMPTGNDPLRTTYIDVYVTTLSPRKIAGFFEKEIKDFKKSIR